eukprot:1144870-Pelagomonas_calceolata.AAC.3
MYSMLAPKLANPFDSACALYGAYRSLLQVQTQFVRAHTWTLGPISIQQPVMMTMTLDGLVRGGPMDGDVIGITGYDLFRCKWMSGCGVVGGSFGWVGRKRTCVEREAAVVRPFHHHCSVATALRIEMAGVYYVS